MTEVIIWTNILVFVFSTTYFRWSVDVNKNAHLFKHQKNADF